MAVSYKTSPAPSATIRAMTDQSIPISLGWVIVYVDDPVAVSDFYVRTFGLTSQFVGPGGTYAQLDTGPTKLAFAAYTLGDDNFPGGVRRAGADGAPPNVEVVLVHDDVDAAHR